MSDNNHVHEMIHFLENPDGIQRRHEYRIEHDHENGHREHHHTDRDAVKPKSPKSEPEPKGLTWEPSS